MTMILLSLALCSDPQHDGQAAVAVGQALAKLRSSPQADVPIATAPAPKPIATPTDPYDAAVQRAQREGLPLVVVFTDPSICPPCRRYEPTLDSIKDECVLLKVRPQEYPNLRYDLRVAAIPTTVVATPDLKILRIQTGEWDRSALRDMISKARK